MLHTRSVTEHQVGAERAILPTIVTVDVFAEGASARRGRLAAEQAVDAVLADSFPASDPPSWNPGTALLNPAVGSQRDAKRSEAIARAPGTGRRVRSHRSLWTDRCRPNISQRPRVARRGSRYRAACAVRDSSGRLAHRTLGSRCRRAIRLALRRQYPLATFSVQMGSASP